MRSLCHNVNWHPRGIANKKSQWNSHLSYNKLVSITTRTTCNISLWFFTIDIIDNLKASASQLLLQPIKILTITLDMLHLQRMLL